MKKLQNLWMPVTFFFYLSQSQIVYKKKIYKTIKQDQSFIV